MTKSQPETLPEPLKEQLARTLGKASERSLSSSCSPEKIEAAMLQAYQNLVEIYTQDAQNRQTLQDTASSKSRAEQIEDSLGRQKQLAFAVEAIRDTLATDYVNADLAGEDPAKLLAKNDCQTIAEFALAQLEQNQSRPSKGHGGR